MQRLLYTVAVMVLAVASASTGAWLWQRYNSPPALPSPMSAASEPVVTSPAPVTLAVGDRRPALTLRDLDDRRRSISEWDGKLLFVNFWATWCPPCLEEIPMFVRMYERYRDRGVAFLGIALDSPERVRTFMQANGVSYESLHGEQDAIDAARAFGNTYGALPYTAVVGRDGRILRLHAGILEESDVTALVEANPAGS